MTLNLKHPVVRWVLIGLATIAVAVAGWFLVGRLFPDNQPSPTKSEQSADSLRITKAAEQALLDSIDARIASRGILSSGAESGARTSQVRADQSRRRADSLAIARQWESAYGERSMEADTLRKAVTQKDTVILLLKADTADLRTQLGIVNRRLEKTEAVVVGLRWDLQQARRCKILGLLNCPSRIQTVALTAVAFYAVDRYQRR